MLLNVLKHALRSFLGKKKASTATFEAPPNPQEFIQKAQEEHSRGSLDVALHDYDRALSLLEPSAIRQRAALLVNVGALLRERVRLPEAIERLREAIRLDSSLAPAHYNLGLTLYETGNAEEAEPVLIKAIELDPAFQAAHSTLLCLYGLARSQEPAYVLGRHRHWATHHADPLTAAAAEHSNDRTPGRPLTVGYVSADFREHSIARVISPILANHDRSRFRVICYDNWPVPDATTRQLQSLAHSWRKIDKLDDASAAELIRADAVDILVDLSGHTAGNRLLVFARKPAPVQASWLGYMCTTGMAAMDWRITDAYLDPPGASEHRYTEKLARIASAAAFEPHPDSPTVTEAPAISRGFVRFGSFNNYIKIDDEVIVLWITILATLPTSRLILVALGGDAPDVQASIRARFHNLAGDPSVAARVDIVGRRPLKQFLQMFKDVDIALDPFPYGGGTTSLHTLWMGVPIVTLEGNSELARSTSGMMIGCGLESLVARSEKHYLDIAVHLAKDLHRLDELRKSIRSRLSESTLGNAESVTRSLEEAYHTMWSEYLREKSN